MAGIQPAAVPPWYKNTIDDLLLEILNKLPVPNGNSRSFLNGQFHWLNSGLPVGFTSIEINEIASQIVVGTGSIISFGGSNLGDGLTAYMTAGPDDGIMVWNGKFRVGSMFITQLGELCFSRVTQGSFTPAFPRNRT